MAEKNKQNQGIYDTIIIGAGAAGLSAAVFAARAGMKTLIIGDPNQSMVAMAADIGNYIGTDNWSGKQWLEVGLQQIKKYGAEHVIAEVVHVVKQENNGIFYVKTSDAKQYQAKTIIICVGIAYKTTGIRGEKELVGRGIHYCVACDGWYYKNKKVAVIGNGNFAAEEAIELTSYARDITIISNGQEFQISQEFMNELKKNNIKMIDDKVREFRKDDKGEKIAALILENGKSFPIDGLFVAIGTATALDFSNKLALDLDEKQNIKVNRETGETSLAGCYAAGGCIGGTIQIAKSVGDGCVAAISAIKKVKGISRYVDHT